MPGCSCCLLSRRKAVVAFSSRAYSRRGSECHDKMLETALLSLKPLHHLHWCPPQPHNTPTLIPTSLSFELSFAIMPEQLFLGGLTFLSGLIYRLVPDKAVVGRVVVAAHFHLALNMLHGAAWWYSG